MAISLLDAVKQALGESGVEVPSVVVGNTDDLTALYVANRAAQDLREFQLQKLRKFGSITLTTATEYSLASDFWAYVPDTLVQDGGGALVNMPTTPTDWIWLKAGIGVNDAVFNCRFINDKLEVQNPVEDAVLRYEYISKHPITTSNGVTSKEAFTLDTDVCILDSTLFKKFIKWAWKKEKGIGDWKDDYADFEKSLRYRLGADAGAQTLVPGGSGNGRSVPWFNPYV